MWQGEMKRETDRTLTLKVPGCIYLGKWLRISVLNYEMEILINNLKWLAGTAITYSFGQHSRHVCESFCHCDKHPRKSLMEGGFILAYDFRVSAHDWPHCCGFWWGRMWWWEVCGRTELLTSLHPGSKERMTVLWSSPLLFCLTLACWLLQPREGRSLPWVTSGDSDEPRSSTQTEHWDAIHGALQCLAPSCLPSCALWECQTHVPRACSISLGVKVACTQ